MPNQQINSITSATTTDGSELLPVVSGGVTKSVSVSTINSGIAADAVSDVYDARDLAVGQSSIAAAAALAAGSIAQQDLTAVSAALHRSPNAVTSMFVYDTSKDSDGGAWTEKCQHTSWYNETLSGKWLGAQVSEFYARNANAALGSELIPSVTSLVAYNANTQVTISGNKLIVTGVGTGLIGVTLDIPEVLGRTYQIDLAYENSTKSISVDFGGSPKISGLAGALSTSVKTAITGLGNPIIYMAGVAGDTFTVTLFSIREVISQTTQSGDYFQLTTDGKFYRLWKNLLKYSEDFNNALWVKTNLSVVTNNETAPDGTPTADQLIENSVNGYHHIDSNSTSVIPGYYSIRVYLKANGKTLPVVQFKGVANEGYAVYDLTGVTATATNATASITSAGNGWYLCKLTVQATASGTGYVRIFLDSSQYQGNSVSGVYIWGAQLEYGSVATTYEAKTADGTTSEVFRGIKREFPKLSAIVAEVNSGRNTVAIYDLTEPGRPMWASYYYSPQNQWLTSALCAMNGVMFFGGYATPSYSGSGFFEIDFIRSNSHFTNGGAGWVPAAKVNITSGDISTKPGTTATRYTNQTFYGEVTQVSMCVLPGTPDTISGLPMPTIAAITSGWQTKTVYVITHDGKVCRSNNVGNDFKSIKFNEKHILANAGTSWYSYLNPATINANFTLTATAGDSLYAGSQKNVGKRSHSARVTGNSLNPFVFNETAVQKSINATITNTYNTGHMVGDIRRTYLADTAVGSVYSPALTMQNMITTAQQGVWYDPSDTTTLYQDAAGTTPVTAVEQPVGLMLDKRDTTYSTYFDGAGDRLDVDNSSSLQLANTDFTIEFWVNYSTSTQYVHAVSKWNSNDLEYQIIIDTTSATVAANISSDGTNSDQAYILVSANNAISANNWRHVAWVRSSTVDTLYVNGVSVATTAARPIRSGTSKVSVSGRQDAVYFGASYISNLRIVKGTALYTANFTPPTAPLTAVAGTSLLTCGTTWSGNPAITTVGNARADKLNPFKTGTGNHAFNSSGNSANFPVLSARYNLLTKTEDFADASAWSNATNISVSANSTVAPNGTQTADTLTLTTASGYTKALNTSALSAGTYTQSGSFRRGNTDWVVFYFSDTGANYAAVWANLATGQKGTVTAAGSFSAASATVTPEANGFYRVSLTFTKPTTVAVDAFGSGPVSGGDGSFTRTAGDSVIAWGADLRVSNDALNQPAYQRVNTSTDYDTVGFKPYLRFNGTNQWLQTNSIDFSATDKMFVSAGVRKLSDATTGIVYELSTATESVFGGFYLAAPNTGAGASYQISTRSSGGGNMPINVTGIPAPITNVSTSLYDLSVSSMAIRFNGITNTTRTGGAGGVFGNYPLYVGARAGSSLYFNGRLYQLVIVNKMPTADELKSTETTINRKTLAYAEQ